MQLQSVKLGKSGRIVLPVSIRKACGLEEGELLTIRMDDDAIKISSRRMAVNNVRAAIIKERGSLNGILDEFMEERREEARREMRDS